MKAVIAGINSPFWPHAFAEAFQHFEEAELVGFTALSADPAEIEACIGMGAGDFAEKTGLKQLPDLSAALDAADALLVCTRHTAMPEVIIQALHAGKHVFAAKPIGVVVEDLRRVREALRDGTVFSAGMTARSEPAFAAAAELVRQGMLGKLHTMRVMHHHGKAPGPAWYQESEEGNACNYFGWYPLDAATALLGPVTNIWGFSQQLANDVPLHPDHLKAVTEHESGLMATLDVYWDIDLAWQAPMLEFELVGSNGLLRYHGPDETVAWHKADGVERVPFMDRPPTLRQDLKTWIDACRGEGQPALPAVEALSVALGGCAWNVAAAGAGAGHHRQVIL